MKIRNGFVSNSSSSSFCILGYKTGLEEMLEIFKIPHSQDNDNYDSIYEDIEKVINEADKRGYEAIINEDPECGYIGFAISGKSIPQILELGIQPNDDDKVSLLKKMMNKVTIRSYTMEKYQDED